MLGVDEAEHGDVKAPELPPSIGGVLILDLDNGDVLIGAAEEYTVRLAPAASANVLKGKPRGLSVNQLIAAERRRLVQVVMNLAFIHHAPSFRPTAASTFDKRRLRVEYLRPLDVLRGKEVVRRWA